MKSHLPFYTCLIVLFGILPVRANTNLVGSLAPAPIFVTLSGQYQMMSKLYNGVSERTNGTRTAVVLNFMSLKCAPCQKELPFFLETVRSSVFNAQKNGEKLRFFLVSIDPLSAKEDLRTFLLENDISPDSQVLLDPYRKGADKFGVVSIPRTVVIDAYGLVTADISGAVDNYRELLKTGIQKALKPYQKDSLVKVYRDEVDRSR